jgi:hypothetical protein
MVLGGDQRGKGTLIAQSAQAKDQGLKFALVCFAREPLT